MSNGTFLADGTPRRNPCMELLRHIAAYRAAHDGADPHVQMIRADLGWSVAHVYRVLGQLEGMGAIRRRQLRGPGAPKAIDLLIVPQFTPSNRPPWFDVEDAARRDWGGALPRPVQISGVFQ